PKETEPRIYKIWEDSGYFTPENLPVTRYSLPVTRYCIVIPPPNVTGSLHMGHALNATIQDILIRQKRMQGYKTLWVPGTDHAGIATQNVVEKELKKQGLTRHDLGKEKFLEKVWKWKNEYGNIILDQLKKLGSSCDWSRARFTMDPDYAQEVEKAFLHYYKKGWIYQGDRVINWCTRCQTSLSDLELEYEETKGNLYYIKYGPLTVATTRPETMLGDTAVAVNPKDKRYKDLIGKIVILPLVNREIPIIADRLVDPKFGTGAVKVTPAHDMADAEIGERHKLESIQVINQFGKIELGHSVSNRTLSVFNGLSTKEAREKILKELEAQEFLEKVENYDLRISKCYRCGSVIEPQISKQWFLKMDRLAKKAKEAVKKGKVVFHPKRWEKIYFDWLDNIKDWCISRQIWWGHKIPIDGVDDVLDTWFSSALWPFAVFNDKEKKEFYPTQVLSTARDIINLWVARMIFSGLEFMKEKPFKDVIIHPTILTKEGKRMSKSLGTGIDPMILIEKYGADATRFGLIYQMMGGQDIHFNEDHCLAGKKFANKIWNATRFVLEKSSEENFNEKKLSAEDKGILKKLSDISKSANKNLNHYKFGQALHEIYDFFWHDFCDLYIEYSKKSKFEETNKVLLYTLKKSLTLLHPFMPFITEEIWSIINTKGKNLLLVEKWDF
ncbi:valine--tRNA ligase, partial [Patescibacteria group bacterium]|nr:valine--tRNA ligase [Patescibacteria group bacterium]